MKLWFKYDYNYLDDEGLKFGVVWYRHKNPRWGFGFTAHFMLLNRALILNFVKDFDKYRKIMGE